MASPPGTVEDLALRVLAPLDATFTRLYGWRGNPLLHSGAIVGALLLVLIVTGLWLILFYRVGSPYGSVAAITADPWVGRWVRGIHRYASDAAVVAAGVHALRMFAQGRSWGPRALAWCTGVLLVLLLYGIGLTGYVMVWDTFAYAIAVEGARLLDSLPVLSEPIGRAFTGEETLLGPFFFLNLFAHIALPLGLALVLWLHVSRLARPVLLPPRRLTIALVAVLVALAFLRPVGMQPEATPFLLPAQVVIDLLYGFWLPIVRPLPAGIALASVVTGSLLVFLVPVMTRRRGTTRPRPSSVDESRCTGCRQCSLDCPYDAISMIARAPGGRAAEFARVDPDLCVSCGICAGSCAPMAVGPPGRTGRDQLARVREFIAQAGVGPGRHVVVCCERGARAWGHRLAADGAAVHPVDCTGSLHTSVVELLVRAGAEGVLVISCPPRDCWNREGPRWLNERLYHEREAELKARVDRHRIRLVHAGAGEAREALAALRAFRRDTIGLASTTPAALAELELDCARADPDPHDAPR